MIEDSGAPAIAKPRKEGSEGSLRISDLVEAKEGSQESPISLSTDDTKRTPDDTAPTFPAIDSETECKGGADPSNRKTSDSSISWSSASKSTASGSAASGGNPFSETPPTSPAATPKPRTKLMASRKSMDRNPKGFYNPMSNYAPNRRKPRRHEIMGMNIFAYDPQPESPPTYHQSDDESSVDSEEALERAAHRIRAELRLAEMAELAAAAERAAEAGEESFAAQPSTYGRDDVDLTMEQHNRKERLKRRSTVGAAPYQRFRRPRKVAIMDLRVADDVFPSFDSFHNHLRTHFTRSAIPRSTLILKEDPQREYGIPDPEPVGPRNFLGSFSFENWIPGKQSTRPPDPAARAVTCGDLVSCHKHDPDSKLRIRQHRIDVPPGLDVSEELSRFMYSDSSTHTLAQTCHTDSRVDNKGDAAESCDNETSSSENTPVRQDAPANTSFVTPARLQIGRAHV